MKISIILGTRPEIIKFSPIIRESERLDLDYFIIHTGQHYSYNMDEVFFEQLELPEARYNLEVGPGTHAGQTGRMLIGIEKILRKEKPDMVLVEGDTNSTLAGALAAVKLNVMTGHVEAGLRSYDREMPEEINRIITDHCSDLLFTPTEESRRLLVDEGIPKDKIFLTGNTIVDAVFQNLKISESKIKLLDELGINSNNYFLATAHRAENIDNEERFRGILKGLEMVKDKFNMPILYPMHPRTKKQMETLNIQTDNLRLIEPLDYLSFLQLESNARLVFTDSGGVQEETCILKIPCVTLRYSTERPETIYAGANILAGTKPYQIVKTAQSMLKKENRWKNPFGNGNAGKRIVEITRTNGKPSVSERSLTPTMKINKYLG